MERRRATVATLVALSCLWVLAAGCDKSKTEQRAQGDSTVQNVDADEGYKLFRDRDDLLVLDVRTEEEYREAHIDGARNIDFRGDGFADQLGELDREQPVLIHCRSGARSTSALDTMRELGFRSVYHLDGGIQAWIAKGHPVEKP